MSAEKRNRLRLRLHARIAGREGATIILEPLGRSWLFVVRPLRSRRTYRMLVETVAELVCWKVAKQEDAQRRREKGGKK